MTGIALWGGGPREWLIVPQNVQPSDLCRKGMVLVPGIWTRGMPFTLCFERIQGVPRACRAGEYHLWLETIRNKSSMNGDFSRCSKPFNVKDTGPRPHPPATACHAEHVGGGTSRGWRDGCGDRGPTAASVTATGWGVNDPADAGAEGDRGGSVRRRARGLRRMLSGAAPLSGAGSAGGWGAIPKTRLCGCCRPPAGAPRRGRPEGGTSGYLA